MVLLTLLRFSYGNTEISSIVLLRGVTQREVMNAIMFNILWTKKKEKNIDVYLLNISQAGNCIVQDYDQSASCR